jgi:hypothetical protein
MILLGTIAGEHSRGSLLAQSYGMMTGDGWKKIE